MHLPRKRTFNTLIILLILAASSRVLADKIPPEIKAVLLPTPSPAIQRNDTPLPKTQSPKSNSAKQIVKVIRVVDGDTIVIEGNIKLRYIGINAPESVDPRRPVQCFGKEASDRNKELVEGKTVSLEKDVSETDKYGRLLRYVYLDGIMINKQLVSEGYAFASSYPPDITHQQELKNAENDARTSMKGLWNACPDEIKSK